MRAITAVKFDAAVEHDELIADRRAQHARQMMGGRLGQGRAAPRARVRQAHKCACMGNRAPHAGDYAIAMCALRRVLPAMKQD